MNALDDYLKLAREMTNAWDNACNVLPSSRAKSVAITQFETARLWLNKAWEDELAADPLPLSRGNDVQS